MSQRPGEVRSDVVNRLSARRDEIERAIFTRIQAISDESGGEDPTYAQGLRSTVGIALDYGLATLERGENQSPPVPAELLAQARLAARSGVDLELVLRRYIAGFTLLGDFLLEEARAASPDSFRQVLREQATLFERLIGLVAEQYGLEKQRYPRSSQQRRADRVQKLLEGEFIDSSDLGYEFDLNHIGVVTLGEGGEKALRELGAALDHRLLVVPREGQVVWAWLGTRRAIDATEYQLILARALDRHAICALGEPGRGLEGWRRTHQQAKVALAIARLMPGSVTRYIEVALLASTAQDRLLKASLEENFLTPLATERSGGEMLRQTLRAHIDSGFTVSATAAKLGVKRHTVTNRLRLIESRLGQPLSSCVAEIDIALRVDGLKSEN